MFLICSSPRGVGPRRFFDIVDEKFPADARMRPLERAGGTKRVRRSLTQRKSQGKFRDSGKNRKFPNDFKDTMPRSGNASGKTNISSLSRTETAINAHYNGVAKR